MLKLVDELLVECSQRQEGCTHICQRQLLASHLKDSCQYVHVPCSDVECDQVVLRKDQGKRGHDCLHLLTDCEGCGDTIKNADIEVSPICHHREYFEYISIRTTNHAVQQGRSCAVFARMSFSVRLYPRTIPLAQIMLFLVHTPRTDVHGLVLEKPSQLHISFHALTNPLKGSLQ